MAVKTPVGSALELADQTRRATATASPFELWQLASVEAAWHTAARIERYRHAMIHAGHLRNAKGAIYKRCPMCHTTLSR